MLLLFGFAVGFENPAVNCRKSEWQSGKRSEICLSSEQREGELFRFPLCRSLFRGPEGQFAAVAFLCLLSLAKQRK
jgi:hypothetical protein